MDRFKSLFNYIGVIASAVVFTVLIQSYVRPSGQGVDEIEMGSGATLAGECTIGEIRMFAGNFAPRSWAKCDGQLLAVNSNAALFSIIGTTYGGDGRTTFGLPDLRSKVPMHAGSGPGQAPCGLGQACAGNQGVEVLTATGGGKTKGISSVAASDLSHPSLGLNFIICLEGIYPSRN